MSSKFLVDNLEDIIFLEFNILTQLNFSNHIYFPFDYMFCDRHIKTNFLKFWKNLLHFLRKVKLRIKLFTRKKSKGHKIKYFCHLRSNNFANK